MIEIETTETFFWDKVTGDPCPRQGNVLCTLPHDSAHRHEHRATTTEEEVEREDKYRIRVGGVSVVASDDQEARIRAMTAEQRASFQRLMGGIR